VKKLRKIAKKLRIFYSIEYFKSTKFMRNYG